MENGARKNHKIWAILGLAVVLVLLITLSIAATRSPSDPAVTHQVFFDVDIDGQRAGKIVLGLHGSILPRTVENFRALCTGERGKGSSGKRLHYKGTIFHRIIPGFMIQGGDITRGDGRGGESIYPGGAFRNENFKLHHDHAGVLSMVNNASTASGVSTSQFFITTVKASWLDGQHAVFGRVLSGMDVVYMAEGSGSYSGRPRKVVRIVHSGEIPREKW
ncbi:hypothetical protein SELMODRAFT_92951 [Selaginella moellendorffii]|uniref:Peptidyl-prolyl cis-trans isomerase n=1 Tax=Selaginella moellendorffii TaxID=88036 RepID=D8RFW9_SELML|nr:peptidyl-prolyl cis-trans isomerase CYP21-1 [Selaginella moellendorffii]EFJ29198.1 hypothetical protein SELMODRAFT_92951 [Selaginella moellendorffii]|eukprot:XP_002970074.1 peptidyl-prolyl cis-trans isomerase CYP21-1 [Selaginella moellendorffii]